VGDKFVILKCEGMVEARQVDPNEVREELTESIKEHKLREVAAGLFAKLQESAVIQNVLNDPQRQQSMPGVVATVNGEKITMQELGQECLVRHGEEVLETEISHLLLEQELKRANSAILQAEIDAEIAHAATLSGVVNPQGQPDLQKWIKMATDDQGVSYAQYIRDAVWPSVALKKLTREQVAVTADDLDKGFQANYGERVTCRAIVLGNMRRAQEVWEKARGNTSIDYFGDLAEEYSVEPTSKALRGEVPPIRKYGGQPQLEDVAFKLKPGELSGIIQMGDKFVLLKCEGRTKPVEVNPAAVRDVLHQDIYEKKLRVAMAERYEAIRSKSRIDNYLAGTSHAPPAKNAQGQPRRDTAVRPTSSAQQR
jgi:parvulin-like peptidyl-prolyl isomerase